MLEKRFVVTIKMLHIHISFSQFNKKTYTFLQPITVAFQFFQTVIFHRSFKTISCVQIIEIQTLIVGSFLFRVFSFLFQMIQKLNIFSIAELVSVKQVDMLF